MPSLRLSGWLGPLALLVAALAGPQLWRSDTSVHADQAIAYPDLESIIPTSDIHISVVEGRKELDYSHYVYNAGPGPLEVRPVYDPATDSASGYQRLAAAGAPDDSR